MRVLFKRSAKRFPYRSHLQWIRAAYGAVACSIFALFQGWQTFIPPMSVKDFAASYIAVRALILISNGILIDASLSFLLHFPWHTSLRREDSIQ
jgi:yeast amino acid transporter